MSERSRKSRRRLRVQERQAWFDLPRRLSRYESLLVVLAGAVFVGMARQELSGRGIDASMAGVSRSGRGSTSSGPEGLHYAFGVLLVPVAATTILTGVAGLLARRRR